MPAVPGATRNGGRQVARGGAQMPKRVGALLSSGTLPSMRRGDGRGDGEPGLESIGEGKRRAGAEGRKLTRGLCRDLTCQGISLAMMYSLLLVPSGLAQNLQFWSIPQLNAGMARCHERVSALSCDRQLTEARTMTTGRNVTSFADLEGIGRMMDTVGDLKSLTLDAACRWNPVMQTCEYRCNHLYQFPRTRLAERINSIRVESHYVFEEFGAACTAFNIAPEQNGNKDCKICEDPYFNPPECYKIKDEFGDYILKHDDCMTKCNMLPNCSNLCPNLLLETASYAGKSAEVIYMDCCIPQRRQLNGETLDVSREMCCREYQLLSVGLSPNAAPEYDVSLARNHCCNVIERDVRGHTEYCASEICHFKQMEEDISNGREIWVESALKAAMETECVGGSCGLLGEVVSTSDGQMGAAMQNNLIGATDPAERSQVFFEMVLRELPFDALLNPDTVKISTGIETFFEDSVRVGSFFFNAYFKTCNVNDPCKLQEGVEYENLRKKYLVLTRALMAANYFPDAVVSSNRVLMFFRMIRNLNSSSGSS